MSVNNIVDKEVKPEYIDKIIVSHLGGNSSETDDMLLLEWISSSRENLNYFSEIKAVWYATGQYRTELQDKMKNAGTRPVGRRTLSRALYSLAAIALILSAAFIGFRTAGRNTVTVENVNSKTERVVLPDGTAIWLYEGSRLSYNEKRYDDRRKVKLSGEADLDVASNKLRPFVLTCPKITVKVLGTVFNVKDYPDRAEAQTTLAEGAVELTLNRSSNKVSMREGQRVTYDQHTKDFKIEEVNTSRLSLRRLGIISLEDVTINDIVFRLQNEFGRHVYFTEPDVDLKKRYVFNYPENAGLEDIISLLEVVTSTEIEIE